MRPARAPIGLQLNQSARIVTRAFDEALGVAGGSLPVWLVLLNLKTRRLANQRQLAAAIGLREATLTNHLNTMEADGLVTRRRDPANRRIQVVDLTDTGEAAFARLRDAAIAFDRRLRDGFSDADLEALARLLDRLTANAGRDSGGPSPPGRGPGDGSP